MRFDVVNRIPIKRRVRFSTKTGRTYVDAKTAADLKMVEKAYKGPFYTCPVALIVFIYKPLPKARWKKGKEPFDQKPDIDNVLKAIMDGIKGVAYMDDNQVTITHVKKLDRRNVAGEYAKFAVVPAEKVTGVIVDGSTMEG